MKTNSFIAAISCAFLLTACAEDAPEVPVNPVLENPTPQEAMIAANADIAKKQQAAATEATIIAERQLYHDRQYAYSSAQLGLKEITYEAFRKRQKVIGEWAFGRSKEKPYYGDAEKLPTMIVTSSASSPTTSRGERMCSELAIGTMNLIVGKWEGKLRRGDGSPLMWLMEVMSIRSSPPPARVGDVLTLEFIPVVSGFKAKK